MELDIKRLIDSDNKLLRSLGWFLYNNAENGLSREGVYELLNILNEDTLQCELDNAYSNGWDDCIINS